VALATRELELVIIARDNASATLARVGGAFVILGAQIARAGIGILQELGSWTSELMDFQQQIALAVTQAEGVGATMENVSAISRNVGTTLPIPFEELNDALFDIFSTLDLDSLEQAEEMLMAFGESAVAGQAPIRDIARSTIGWLNALDMAPTIENVTRLLDNQFELVRKGAGTYGEFSGEVGKAIPAFVVASQEVETFGGMMAFMTRDSMSAAMAATSAARAVELMFTPKAIGNLREMGVAVEDAEGNFRQIDDILADLQPHMKDLTDSEFKVWFKETFGQGRIQARRFFDLARKDFPGLVDLIDAMEGSAGGAAEAFAIMMGTDRSQMDLFKNQWEAIRMTIASAFLPILREHVFPALNQLFEWWDKLNPEMQEQIARWAGLGAAGMVIAGIIMTIVGGFVLLSGLLRTFTNLSGIMGLVKIMGVWSIVAAAIAGAAFLIWKNWDKIGPVVKRLWNKVKPIAKRLQEMWDKLVPAAKEAWDNILEAVENFIETNKEWFGEMRDKIIEIWNAIEDHARILWVRITQVWRAAIDAISAFWRRWGESILQWIAMMWEELKNIISRSLDIVKNLWAEATAILRGDWSALWEAVKNIFSSFWSILKSIAKRNIETVTLLFAMAWSGIVLVAKDAWERIKNIVASGWQALVRTAKRWTGNLVRKIKEFFMAIPGVAKDMWDNHLLPFFEKLPGLILDALSNALVWLYQTGADLITGLWNGIIDFWAGTLFPWLLDLPILILSAIGELINTLFNLGIDLIQGLWNGVLWLFDGSFWEWLKDVGPSAKSGIGDLLHTLWFAGWDLIQGLWNGVMFVWEVIVWPFLKNLPTTIVETIGKLNSILLQAGIDLINGLWDGMKQMWTETWNWIKELPGKIAGIFSNVLSIGSPSRVMKKIGVDIMAGLKQGMQSQESSFFAYIRNLNQRLLDAVRIPSIGEPGTLSAPLGTGTSTTNNINVNVQSTADPDEIANTIVWHAL
jgi:TP901 family phage tail tape measure protein